jgi:hypothetical protein
MKKFETIKDKGVLVKLGPFEWFIEPKGSVSVGMLQDGTLIGFEHYGENDNTLAIYTHGSFKEMASDKNSHEYENSVLRAVAHKLGLKTWEGFDGEQWDIDLVFPDLDFEEQAAYTEFHEKGHLNALKREFAGNLASQEFQTKAQALFREHLQRQRIYVV